MLRTACRFLTCLLLTLLGVASGALYAQGESGFTGRSHLPIVVVETDGRPIPNERKLNVFMGVIDNGPGVGNRIGDPFSGYEGWIGIELRGSSSLLFPKKQFAVETREADGSNRNVSLLGLPRENDWVFSAPYSDKTLVRNVLVYRLARDMGRYASRARFFELVLNGNYRGVYVLFERIKRDDARVDIATLNPDENEGDDLTGGYIIKVDKRDGENVGGWTSPYPPAPGSPREIFYQYHEPPPDEITVPQQQYIQSVVARFEDWMAREDISGYSSLIDVGSFVDFFLLQELSRNVDGYRLSSFFYKDKDSNDPRLHAGPLWDFNLGFGNANYFDGAETAGWQYTLREDLDQFQIPFWWRVLLDDDDFTRAVQERWAQLRYDVLDTDRIHELIDAYVDTLGPAVDRNFARWPVLGTYVWPNDFVGDSYAEEVDYLKTWIADRLEWMDRAIPTLGEAGSGMDGVTLDLYPNPTARRLVAEYSLPGPHAVRLDVYDVLGRRVRFIEGGERSVGRYLVPVPDVATLPAGTYLVRLRYGDRAITRTFVRLPVADR